MDELSATDVENVRMRSRQIAHCVPGWALAAALALPAPCLADGLAELDDAGARLQYAAYTADARALEEVLGLLTKMEESGPNAALREYYLGYGYWQLGEVYGQEARDGRRKSGERDAMRARQECVRHAQSAEKLEARMAEAHAIDAVCSNLPPERGSKARASCEQHRALRTAIELDSDNPRVRLIEVLCAVNGGAMTPATFEKVRALVTAFEAAPASRPGQLDWGHAEVLALLGKGLIERGDNVAARDALERALVIAPDYRAAQQLLQAAATRPK